MQSAGGSQYHCNLLAQLLNKNIFFTLDHYIGSEERISHIDKDPCIIYRYKCHLIHSAVAYSSLAFLPEYSDYIGFMTCNNDLFANRTGIFKESEYSGRKAREE